MHARALGFDSLQYLVVGRVVSQCVSKVFECLLVNAKLEEKAKQRILSLGRWELKRELQIPERKRKLKIPTFVP